MDFSFEQGKTSTHIFKQLKMALWKIAENKPRFTRTHKAWNEFLKGEGREKLSFEEFFSMIVELGIRTVEQELDFKEEMNDIEFETLKLE